MKCHQSILKRQYGAALIVGLILLLLASLTAIITVKSIGVDHAAISAEQYSERALRSAEMAIEHALRNDAVFNSSADLAWTRDTRSENGNDTFRYTVTRPNSGIAEPAPSGISETKFAAVYFRITSVGRSEQRANAETTQEVYQIIPIPDTTEYRAQFCKSVSSLDADASRC